MAFGRIGPGSSDDYEDMAEINIIPLVDVMLVLLIIFMVTAPLSIGGISVKLPTTKPTGATAIGQDRIVLTVDSNGSYFIDKDLIGSAALEKKLQAIYEFRDQKELYIRADEEVPYGKVVYAMSIAKTVGVDKLAMLTKNDGK